MEQIAEDVDPKERKVFRLLKIEVGLVHVGLGHAEKLPKDEPRLIEGAHPGGQMIRRKSDLKMVPVVGVSSKRGKIVDKGLTGSDKEVMKFRHDELLPVAIGFGAGRRVGEKARANTGGIALLKDGRQVLKTVEKHGVKTGKAEALETIGLEAEVFHSDFSRRASNW